MFHWNCLEHSICISLARGTKALTFESSLDTSHANLHIFHARENAFFLMQNIYDLNNCVKIPYCLGTVNGHSMFAKLFKIFMGWLQIHKILLNYLK